MWFGIVLCYVVLSCVVLYCIVLNNFVLYFIVWCGCDNCVVLYGMFFGWGHRYFVCLALSSSWHWSRSCPIIIWIWTELQQPWILINSFIITYGTNKEKINPFLNIIWLKFLSVGTSFAYYRVSIKFFVFFIWSSLFWTVAV